MYNVKNRSSGENLYWTLDEDQFLIENYRILGSKGTADVLGRLPSACRNRAYHLKITRDISWSPEEEQFLKDNYGSQGAVWVSKQLGRSKSSCIAHARKLGIQRNYRWTKEQINYLSPDISRSLILSYNRRIDAGKVQTYLQFSKM